ncbi:uncharacterized protein LOC102701824 [Oryza brachyantha]|uniref:Uncharacterized protein n=1 Tax=Oryza brachyantha TaxID=4533 RepID=J3M3M6_ORYBR|nr:uncharacterized protein LOC102701824 [Oryza brachyantha]
MEAAAPALTTTTRGGGSCFAPGRRTTAAAAADFGAARVLPGRRLRALPPELSEILSPKLVPGSPAYTGDTSSLIPISAVMLLFYFVSNWVVPEFIMKGLQEPNKPEEDEATAAPAAAMSGTADGQPETKTRVKVKKTKKNKKAAIKL